MSKERSLEDFVKDNPTISAYFSQIVSAFGRERVGIFAVAHMVPNTLFFLDGLGKLGKLHAVLPKPKSIGRPEAAFVSGRYATIQLTRDWARDVVAVCEEIAPYLGNRENFIIVDIGGYFAPSASGIKEHFGERFLGILEGTENGVMKYERVSSLSVPVLTVARSPLKLPEDHLVASSVVFSIEAILRENAEILQTRTAAVIGYGRVGSSVAELLRGRGINTVIYDSSPIKLAAAAARGFQSFTTRREALARATLVVCATGNRSLDLAGFGQLRSGSVVASVTSADDELQLDVLNVGYRRTEVFPGLSRYFENNGSGRYFSLIADGNAANFQHGAVIGPAIQLIEGEKLAGVKALASGAIVRPGIHELDDATRMRVATIWNEYFL